MPRLTLARAVACAPPINARAPPPRLRIMLPDTRGNFMKVKKESEKNNNRTLSSNVAVNAF